VQWQRQQISRDIGRHGAAGAGGRKRQTGMAAKPAGAKPNRYATGIKKYVDILGNTGKGR
jgi:hypothetical protein